MDQTDSTTKNVTVDEARQRIRPLLRSWAAFSDESPECIDQEIEWAIAEVRRKYPLSRSS